MNKHKDSESISVVSKIAHEVRNNIHSISGIANFLKENWAEVEDSKKIDSIEHIVQSALYLEELNNHLLSFSFLNERYSKNFVEEDIIQIVSSVVDYYRQYIEIKNLSIQMNFNSKIQTCLISIDVFWIKHLLNNLLTNAIKYSQSNIINININSKKLDNKNYFSCTIEDFGIGMSEYQIEYLFKPFDKVYNNYSDNIKGLGLSICYEVVSNHDGEIVANTSNKGTQIEFLLPTR